MGSFFPGITQRGWFISTAETTREHLKSAQDTKKLIVSSMKSLIKKMSKILGYEIIRTSNNIQYFNFSRLLYFCLSQVQDMKIVQIGACDGVFDDPIHDFMTKNHQRINALLVEPLPDYFQELKSVYSSYPNFIPVNCAIHNSEETMTMYRVSSDNPENLPEFTKGISSFNSEHHKKSGIDSKYIIEEKVACISFEQLLCSHQFEDFHFLQIDTEGYDAELILNIDFQRFRPLIIRFEHGLQDGTMDMDEFEKVRSRLHHAGYELTIENSDAVAIHNQLLFNYYDIPTSKNRQK